jgi:hypothetical protein
VVRGVPTRIPEHAKRMMRGQWLRISGSETESVYRLTPPAPYLSDHRGMWIANFEPEIPQSTIRNPQSHEPRLRAS